jgi:hypothetical protein
MIDLAIPCPFSAWHAEAWLTVRGDPPRFFFRPGVELGAVLDVRPGLYVGCEADDVAGFGAGEGRGARSTVPCLRMRPGVRKILGRHGNVPVPS